MDRIGRRRVLGACGGAIGTSLAGCLGGVLDSSSKGPSDGGSSGDGTVPDGARWFPAPAALDRETYGAFSVDVSAFYDHRESLPPELTEDLFDTSTMPGFDDPQQVDANHFVGNQINVAAGSIDREAAVSHYTEQRFDHLEAIEGFTLLEGRLSGLRSRRVIAVGDGAIVAAVPASSQDDEPIRPLVEAVIDAAAGETERYHEANGVFRRLLEALPAGDTFSGGAGPPGGSGNGFRSNGTASSIGASTTDLEAVVHFEENAVEDDQSLVNAATVSDFFQGADVETTIDDGTFRATASVPTDQLERVPLGIL